MSATITIIEDDDDLRELLGLPLRSAGYEVITQSDGNNLDKEEKSSDLYIIDINLGGLSGIDLCKQIKARNHSERMPVTIIISANPDLRKLTMEACADDTLSKPFTSKELLEKVTAYLPQIYQGEYTTV